MYPTIVCVLLVLMTPTLHAQGVPVQDRAANGISLARQGNLVDAEKELRAAVSEAPAVAIYRAQLGSILGLEGKWNEALECFQRAVELAPNNLDFRRETAAVQWQMGLMPAAEGNLQYVLQKRPGDSGALLLLGMVKERTGDYAHAAQLLDSQFELVAAQPERTVALFHSVVESAQTDKISKIVDVLELHANDKSWASALSRCAQLAIVGGNLQAAETLFSLIPTDSSDRLATGLQLVKLLYNRAQVSQAKELLLQLKSQGTQLRVAVAGVACRPRNRIQPPTASLACGLLWRRRSGWMRRGDDVRSRPATNFLRHVGRNIGRELKVPPTTAGAAARVNDDRCRCRLEHRRPARC